MISFAIYSLKFLHLFWFNQTNQIPQVFHIPFPHSWQFSQEGGRRREGKKNHCSEEIKLVKQVSISPIFYEQLFHTNVFCSAFLCLQFGCVIFWWKEISTKNACKLLVKLTSGSNCKVREGGTIDIVQVDYVNFHWDWERKKIDFDFNLFYFKDFGIIGDSIYQRPSLYLNLHTSFLLTGWIKPFGTEEINCNS